MIKLFESSINLFYAEITIGQSSFISSATRTARPFIKLKRSVLLDVQLVKRLLLCNGRQIQHYLASLEVIHDALRY